MLEFEATDCYARFRRRNWSVIRPGHFLVGGPLEALPDPPTSFRSIPLLRRWHLCQALTLHIWKCWSAKYLGQLQSHSKWHHTTSNLKVGDIVSIKKEQTSPTRWPLARVIVVRLGKDGLVRIVAIRTSKRVYTRPVTKLVPLLSKREFNLEKPSGFWPAVCSCCECKSMPLMFGARA